MDGGEVDSVTEMADCLGAGHAVLEVAAEGVGLTLLGHGTVAPCGRRSRALSSHIDQRESVLDV